MEPIHLDDIVQSAQCHPSLWWGDSPFAQPQREREEGELERENERGP